MKKNKKKQQLDINIFRIPLFILMVLTLSIITQFSFLNIRKNITSKAVDSSGVVIKDILPVGLDWNKTTFIQTAGPSISGVKTSNEIIWNIGTVAVGTSYEFEVITYLNSNAKNGNILTNNSYLNATGITQAISQASITVAPPNACTNGAINPLICNACVTGEYFNGVNCVPNICTVGATQSCTTSVGTGLQTCAPNTAGNIWGTCVIDNCTNTATNPPDCNTKTIGCTGLPSSGHATWNPPGTITQTLSGGIWLPSNTGAFGAAQCGFGCDSGYGWDSATSTCKVIPPATSAGLKFYPTIIRDGVSIIGVSILQDPSNSDKFEICTDPKTCPNAPVRAGDQIIMDFYLFDKDDNYYTKGKYISDCKLINPVTGAELKTCTGQITPQKDNPQKFIIDLVESGQVKLTMSATDLISGTVMTKTVIIRVPGIGQLK